MSEIINEELNKKLREEREIWLWLKDYLCSKDATRVVVVTSKYKGGVVVKPIERK